MSLEQAVAAPFCTRQLADYGARVIKIERPGAGDFARSYDGAVNGLSSYFVWLNRSKESVTLDLKQPAALEILNALVSRADVLVQNLGPGAAARLGLDFAQLAPKHPRLIVVDVSGYGGDGPFAQKKAYDLLVQAESGLVSVTGPRRYAVALRRFNRRHRRRDVRIFRHAARASATRPDRARHARRRDDARSGGGVDEPAVVLRAVWWKGAAAKRGVASNHRAVWPASRRRRPRRFVRHSERSRVDALLFRRAGAARACHGRPVLDQPAPHVEPRGAHAPHRAVVRVVLRR